MYRLGELFSLRGTVGRSQYLATGLGLAMVKYSVDAGSCLLLTGTYWDPKTYLDPTFATRMQGIDHLPAGYLAFLVVWALPFLWIGVAMSARRARDAGLSQWMGLGFLLPFVSYLTILLLVLRAPRVPRTPVHGSQEFTFRTALFGLGFTVLVGTGLIALLTEGLHYYGTVLFLGIPFLSGAVTGYLFNAPAERSAAATVGTATLTLLVGFLAMLAFALEGLVCLTMAFPVMWAAVAPGALFGRLLARMSVPPDRTLGLVILGLPLSALAQQHWTRPAEREVMTAIVIDAPPLVVWENVVSFSELPPPDDWLLRTGIAYPLRARIEGQGVGAVRYCEFTTGAFVEPITHWEAPRRLSFDVLEQPDPMQEWSFYAHVNAPHLEQSFRSVRGEFRLTALPSGRTRLEGSTWYRVEMGPERYWKLWGDGIVHRIHGRVLRHIKRLSEFAGRPARD
ncbi:MAG: hypothetical protein QGI93_04275 [Planctomycetota bacterium]|nr:hypothetical protein [Planctomycetota bacterium]